MQGGPSAEENVAFWPVSSVAVIQQFGRWGNRPASLWIARDFGCCARPAARLLAGHLICVQIFLALRLGASTTAISRLPFCQPGKRRCTVGWCGQRTFSISHAVAWLGAQADVRLFPATQCPPNGGKSARSTSRTWDEPVHTAAMRW